ncbi:putative MFS family arabinose efflux permease [Tamaricihabitans halophyticus]|uniref:Putative MFS family arabinose efflux permease n=1 Tax=Tamaricihabitans halophyticus TaxID=1262583 RepID=A0A4R2QXC6_9PSEU|nr:MFS transporter [Tamaricihabitans halophyticus]TCP54377.1 putative MFS family arabinose efflux permease [Tamaricihabitans halophyticus]
MSDSTEAERVPSDPRMVATLWPELLAAAVSLVPFTVFSTFLVPIAREAEVDVAALGSLRGLGGLAALVVGTALAPLLDRVSKELSAAAALVLLGLSSVVGAIGELFAIAAFCLLIGAATAVLAPALSAAAADRYPGPAAAGRAATLVTAVTSMTAMLAGPLVALPALVWGWRGDLLGVAVLALPLAVILFRRRSVDAAGPSEERLGYFAAYRALAAVPGAVALLLIALLRTAAFMGYLAYLAAFYAERFELGPTVFAFVWTLSGASFFVGNLLIGRLVNAADAAKRAERVLVGGLLVAAVAMFGLFLAPGLPVALIATVVLGLSHAAVAACVVSLLVRRCGSMRGSALAINAAGMSFGVFLGAGLGGLGLGFAGYPGIAVVLGGLTCCALVLAWIVRAGSGKLPEAA